MKIFYENGSFANLKRLLILDFLTMRNSLLLIACFLASLLFSIESKNPFLSDFKEKMELTNEDYIALQKSLRKIDLNPLVLKYYGGFDRYQYKRYNYEYFYSRCSKFIFQNFINTESGLFPKKELIKINQGGDSCVVSAAPYAKMYPDLLLSQIKGLKDSGFNGYFLYYLGAYPNPTGKEIVYAGVPYALKIFAMVEAQKLGFNKVLWIDSALYPNRDITPLFDHIEKVGFIAYHKKCDKEEKQLLFPATRWLLKDLTSVDVLLARRVYATMLGFKMDHPLTQSFIKQYYDFVELGTPFISGLPEEFVYSAILGQKEYHQWMNSCVEFERSLPKTFFFDLPARSKSGYFFDWRDHEWVDNVNCKPSKLQSN